MRALVIDDARTMRRIVGRILVDLGYEVMEAGHGEEAISHMEAGFVPDLACVDWNMPVMDGLAYITAVRGMPQWRNVTLMMITTESEQSQVVRALAAGAHEYLIKPFTADSLRDKLDLLGLIPQEAVTP